MIGKPGADQGRRGEAHVRSVDRRVGLRADTLGQSPLDPAFRAGLRQGARCRGSDGGDRRRFQRALIRHRFAKVEGLRVKRTARRRGTVADLGRGEIGRHDAPARRDGCPIEQQQRHPERDLGRRGEERGGMRHAATEPVVRLSAARVAMLVERLAGLERRGILAFPRHFEDRGSVGHRRQVDPLPRRRREIAEGEPDDRRGQIIAAGQGLQALSPGERLAAFVPGTVAEPRRLRRPAWGRHALPAALSVDESRLDHGGAIRPAGDAGDREDSASGRLRLGRVRLRGLVEQLADERRRGERGAARATVDRDDDRARTRVGAGVRGLPGCDRRVDREAFVGMTGRQGAQRVEIRVEAGRQSNDQREGGEKREAGAVSDPRQPTRAEDEAAEERRHQQRARKMHRGLDRRDVGEEEDARRRQQGEGMQEPSVPVFGNPLFSADDADQEEHAVTKLAA